MSSTTNMPLFLTIIARAMSSLCSFSQWSPRLSAVQMAGCSVLCVLSFTSNKVAMVGLHEYVCSVLLASHVIRPLPSVQVTAWIDRTIADLEETTLSVKHPAGCCCMVCTSHAIAKQHLHPCAIASVQPSEWLYVCSNYPLLCRVTVHASITVCHQCIEQHASWQPASGVWAATRVLQS